MINEEQLKQIHKFSFENEKSIKKSEKCGCFYCLKIFDSSEVKDWVNDKNAKTALCPYCTIDSVIGDNVAQITSELLQAMHKYYF